jgi:hypothetical protein
MVRLAAGTASPRDQAVWDEILARELHKRAMQRGGGRDSGKGAGERVYTIDYLIFDYHKNQLRT